MASSPRGLARQRLAQVLPCRRRGDRRAARRVRDRRASARGASRRRPMPPPARPPSSSAVQAATASPEAPQLLQAKRDPLADAQLDSSGREPHVQRVLVRGESPRDVAPLHRAAEVVLRLDAVEVRVGELRGAAPPIAARASGEVARLDALAQDLGRLLRLPERRTRRPPCASCDRPTPRRRARRGRRSTRRARPAASPARSSARASSTHASSASSVPGRAARKARSRVTAAAPVARAERLLRLAQGVADGRRSRPRRRADHGGDEQDEQEGDEAAEHRTLLEAGASGQRTARASRWEPVTRKRTQPTPPGSGPSPLDTRPPGWFHPLAVTIPRRT